MPAVSEPSAVSLPHTFRPFGTRIAVVGFGAALFLVSAVVWLAWPTEIRDQFTFLQKATLVLFGLTYAAFGYALARSRVEAREGGIRVVNGYRTHRYAWSQVLAVSLRPGSPWAVLDLADGTTVGAMGIQGSDGRRAQTQVRQLRSLVDQQTATERDD